MSKTALLFLLATVICAFAAMMPVSPGILSLAGKVGLAIFAPLSFVALLIGRRFKFDPVLR